MSKWTVVKNTNVRKSETFISNFWHNPNYLEPTVFMTFVNSNKKIELPPIIPSDVDPSVKYYPQMSALKKRLMETKSKLDGYNITSWSKHTNFTYLYSDLSRQLREEIEVELCTTAWTKLWEMLNVFLDPRVVNKNNGLRSLFLCEGPGSFITCTNQYLKTQFSSETELNWAAITLADQENTIFDKYFPYWAPNNWFFGPDGTGDILNPNNIVNGIWPKFAQSKCDLITADGSVSCQHDPNNQELIVTPIKLAEIVSALRCLKKGGLFIIKYFTIFEPQTICQLWLLASMFHKFNIFKPVTSKPGNSEVYIVCQKYIGTDNVPDAYFDSLVQCSATSMLFDPQNTVPEKFISFLHNAMSRVVKRQIEVINRNINWFHSKQTLNGKKIYESKKHVCKEYIKKFKIKRIVNANSSMFV